MLGTETLGKELRAPGRAFEASLGTGRETRELLPLERSTDTDVASTSAVYGWDIMLTRRHAAMSPCRRLDVSTFRRADVPTFRQADTRTCRRISLSTRAYGSARTVLTAFQHRQGGEHGRVLARAAGDGCVFSKYLRGCLRDAPFGAASRRAA